jgi:hypothetical protein
MSRDASGNYTLPAGNPVVTGTTIESSWANNTMDDIATSLTNSLDRTGKGGMSAGLKLSDGTVSLPGVAFNSETNTGLYRVSTGVVGFSILGADSVEYSAAALRLISADAGATVGPTLTLHRDSASPAASDVIGRLALDGENDADEQTTYSSVEGRIVTVTDGAEDGELVLGTMQGGALTDVLTLDETGEATFAGGVTVTGTLTLSGGGLSVADLTVTANVTFAGATVADLGSVTTADLNGGTIDGMTINDSVIGGVTPAAATFAGLTATGTITFAGATVADLGSVTTADINGGTVDGTVIGGASAAAGTFTDLTVSGTIDFPNDSLAIADVNGLQGDLDDKAPIASPTFTGTVTIPTADINGGNIDGTAIGAATPAAGTFTDAETTGALTLGAEVVETVYTITGTTPALDPANGTIQEQTLSANTTYSDSLAEGESILLLVDDGASRTITWPTMEWIGGVAPSLDTGDTNVITLVKADGVLIGNFVGIAS